VRRCFDQRTPADHALAAVARDRDDGERASLDTRRRGANGNIFLTDTPDQIRNKVKRAVTDLGREVVYDEKNKPGISNLMVILSLCTGLSLKEISAKYDGYGQFKKDVAEAIIATLEPIHKRFAELSEPGVIEAILAKGAEKAEKVAVQNLRLIQDKMGLVPRPR
jgi:tryptophanyl-tRNA synthetase